MFHNIEKNAASVFLSGFLFGEKWRASLLERPHRARARSVSDATHSPNNNRMPSYTDWCFTYNNPTETLVFDSKHVRAAVWQLESGDSGE